MSAEALLENPSLFNKGEHVHPLQVCDRYVDICKHHFPPDHNNIKRHLFRILDRSLGGAENNDLRIMLGKAKLWEHYRGFVDHIKEHQERLDFSNYIVDYEPSIRVVEDPENHPIIKNPKKNRQEDDVASDNGDNSCCEEEEDVE